MASRLPDGLEPDLFDGSSWVGLVPFQMRGIGLPFGPGEVELESVTGQSKRRDAAAFQHELGFRARERGHGDNASQRRRAP